MVQIIAHVVLHNSKTNCNISQIVSVEILVYTNLATLVLTFYIRNSSTVGDQLMANYFLLNLW